ncbi:MAG: MarR family transcriptional regulator [bacterium]|nr:MAG: MarR family transcriptional regulator [bacterium]
MRIEDEVKTTSFHSIQQKLSSNIIFTHGWAYDQMQEVFGAYGLTSQQYNVLRILRGQYPEAITTANIHNRMLEKNAGVSRLVDRLLKKDFVEKTVCEKDKRLVDVIISDKGLKVLEEIDSEWHRIDAIYSNLSDEEIHTLNGLLDKLRG